MPVDPCSRGTPDLYDTIVLLSGISTENIVEDLDAEEYSWTYGIGKEGLQKLRDFVEEGGTLLAIGDSVPMAQALLDLPIEQHRAVDHGGRKVLPEARANCCRVTT